MQDDTHNHRRGEPTRSNRPRICNGAAYSAAYNEVRRGAISVRITHDHRLTRAITEHSAQRTAHTVEYKVQGRIDTCVCAIQKIRPRTFCQPSRQCWFLALVDCFQGLLALIWRCSCTRRQQHPCLDRGAAPQRPHKHRSLGQHLVRATASRNRCLPVRHTRPEGRALRACTDYPAINILSVLRKVHLLRQHAACERLLVPSSCRLFYMGGARLAKATPVAQDDAHGALHQPTSGLVDRRACSYYWPACSWFEALDRKWLVWR